MRTLGCRSKSAVIAGCVAQLSKEKKNTWDVAMMPLTITDSLKHRKAFDEAQKKRGMHAAQDELYVALCQERTLILNVNRYDESLESYHQDEFFSNSGKLLQKKRNSGKLQQKKRKSTDGSCARLDEEHLPELLRRKAEFLHTLRSMIETSVEENNSDLFERIMDGYIPAYPAENPFARNPSPVVE